MKVLIVGANSILSKQLILQHTNDEVNVLYNSSPSDLINKNFPISHLEKLNPDYDVIYIVSALITNEKEKLEDLLNVNIILIKRITKHFEASRIIYFSSVAVYDGIETGVITNKTYPSPQSFYGMSKLFAERIVRENNNYAILRISSLYGSNMKEDTFLPKVITSAIEKDNITLLGTGERIQNYIHAKDVAILAKKTSLENENKVILAVSPTNYSNSQIAILIQELTDCEVHYEATDASRSIEYFENDVTIKNHMFIPIKEGLKELIEWKTK